MFRSVISDGTVPIRLQPRVVQVVGAVPSQSVDQVARSRMVAVGERGLLALADAGERLLEDIGRLPPARRQSPVWGRSTTSPARPSGY